MERMRQRARQQPDELVPSQAVDRGDDTIQLKEPIGKWRIYIGSQNCLLGEALAKLLAKIPGLQVAGQGPLTEETIVALDSFEADALLLNSSGDLAEDLLLVRAAEELAPDIRVMMLGMSDDPADFLKCVRAGISGYVIKTASSKEVLEAIEVVRQGGAFCPGHLCMSLFNYFHKNAASLPSPMIRDSLGLTQREQELVPLLAKGLSNKRIAEEFCVSEQTVKNHLYRMMQKVGADSRLAIVQLCRSHGLNV